MTDISVIVPIYKSEPYLRACLESIVSQTKREFEVICIDDGSPDNSIAILEEYQEKYPALIRIIRQENQGQSIARNNGIRMSCGRYIAFVDSDDEIKPDALELLYRKATEGDYDIVACDVEVVYPDKTLLVTSDRMDTPALTLPQKKELFLQMYPTVWNKLYKRELFFERGMQFEPNLWYEDVLFICTLISKIESISYVDRPLYVYYQRENSITYTYNERINDLFTVLERAIALYRQSGLYEDYREELEYMTARYLLATYTKRLAKAKDKKRFREGVKQAMAALHETFPDYKKNPYLRTGIKNKYIKYFNPLFAAVIYHTEKNKMN